MIGNYTWGGQMFVNNWYEFSLCKTRPTIKAYPNTILFEIRSYNQLVTKSYLVYGVSIHIINKIIYR